MASYPSFLVGIVALLLLTIASCASAFQAGVGGRSFIDRHSGHIMFAAKSNDKNEEKMSSVDEYRNAPTAILSNFMKKETETEDPLADIDFNVPKSPKLSLEDLAAVLDYELYNKEWFVSGRVNPIYFDDKFEFQDPDV